MSTRFIIRLSALICLSVVFAATLSVHDAQAQSAPKCVGIEQYNQATIKAVQTSLRVAADGMFGPRSCSALIVFQQSQSPPLKDSAGNFGRLGPKTLGALGVTASSVRTVQASASTSSTPSQCRGSKCVVIDQAANQVRAYSSNGSLALQGGMVDNPSKLPKGTYWIGYKQASGIDDSSATVWLPNYMQFSGDIGFHKIPINKTSGNHIHSESYLGTNQKQSGGCIRLGSEFSDQLWSFASIGTTVVVI